MTTRPFRTGISGWFRRPGSSVKILCSYVSCRVEDQVSAPLVVNSVSSAIGVADTGELAERETAVTAGGEAEGEQVGSATRHGEQVGLALETGYA